MTQSGGQGAGIQLQVGLDLAYFRNQLPRLGTTAAGYQLPLNIKFDRKRIADEYRLLNRYISGKEFKVLINSNLKTEIDNANKLTAAIGRAQQAAQGMKGALPVGTGALGLKKGAGQPGANEIKALYEALAIAGAEGFETGTKKTRAQMVTQIGAVAKDTVAGLLNGLDSQDGKVQAAAKSLGESLISSMKAVLGIASPSKEFEKIGKNVGEGFEKGALSSMDNAFDALENKMRQRGKILDTVARGIFRMLGMDPAAMLQQARQQRLPAAINWQATTPPRQPFTGPSSGGRALPPGPTQVMLPGTPFGRQKYLPTALGEELKKVLRDAANAFVDTLKSQVRAAKILDLGKTMQPSLSGSRIAGLLPAAAGRIPSHYSTGRIGGETQAELFARREREARIRSALREMDVMGGGAGRPASPYSYVNRAARPTGAMVPYTAGGALVPAGGGTGGGIPPRPPSGGGGGGMGGFGRALGGINLPGTGVVREIGNEFAMATKQVLLFGTAYKALAFFTSFPAQVGQAVGALQSFRNTLKTIAPTAEEVQASNQFILDTVDRYNVPLESARTGFTRLYASMAPAGFKGDEIRELFLGISKTSATLGLGADQVDRVTYAFGQMASKGQFMAEEVTGQLGDVIPGALSIMAEAAGMGIKEFKKAMEDGAFVGTEFTRVMNNVPKVLEKEFGKGAEGAAKTFQGLINRMQNSTRLLYEAFEPVAVGFLNSVVVPLTSGIKTITDGLNAFFTGTQAKTAGGMAFAQELERLRPTFEGLQANITALIPSFQLFGSVLLNVAKFLATVAGNPITGFLLKVYANVLLVNTAFTLLGGKILAGLIANIGLATSRFIAMNAAVFALQRTSAVTNSTLAGTQLQMMLLQRNATGAIGPVNALLGSLLRMAGIGAIAIGITIIVNGLTQLKDAEARIARLRGEKDPVGPAGPRPIATAGRRYTGATREKVTADQQKQIEYVARLRNELKSLEATQTKAGSALSQTAVGGLSNLLSGFKEENTTAKITELKLLIQNAEEVINLDPNKFRTAAEQQRVAAMATIGGGGGAGAGAGGKPSKERESQIPLLKLELEYSKELFALNSEIFSAQLGGNTLLTTRLEGEKELLDLRYEQLKVDLEQIPAEEKRLKVLAINQRADLARLKTRTAMEEEVIKSIDEQQKAIEAMQSASQLELDNKKAYVDLLQKGIAPAQAKILIEVDNEINKIKSALELTQKRVQAEIDVLKALKAQGKAIDEGLLTKLEGQYGETGEAIGALPGLATEETARRLALGAPKTATEYLAEGLEAAQDNFEELTNIGNQSVMIANSIGDAFGTAFKGIITGSMTAQQALAGMFQSIADSFADMVSKMIAEWLKAQLIQGFMNIFGSVAGSIGTGLSSGFNAGTSSAIDTSSAGWGAAFNTPLKFANGGIASGGFRAFANGGIVSGPTLGLVGEGRYNEAVIPLPDGKSVPVDLGGASGSNISTNIVVNMGNGQGGGGQASGAQGNQLARELEGAVRQVILKESRPGGIIYSR